MHNSDYFFILVFILIAMGMAVAMFLLSKILAPNSPDSEKLSAYECGFEAFDDARSKFDVRFYLVSILFIIFDLEIAFLFPWAVQLKEYRSSRFLFYDVFFIYSYNWFYL